MNMLQTVKKLDEKAVKNFLIDLSKLYKKHKLCLAGCGCCGSPYIKELEDEQYITCDAFNAGYLGDNVNVGTDAENSEGIVIKMDKV